MGDEKNCIAAHCSLDMANTLRGYRRVKGKRHNGIGQRSEFVIHGFLRLSVNLYKARVYFMQ